MRPPASVGAGLALPKCATGPDSSGSSSDNVGASRPVGMPDPLSRRERVGVRAQGPGSCRRLVPPSRPGVSSRRSVSGAGSLGEVYPSTAGPLPLVAVPGFPLRPLCPWCPWRYAVVGWASAHALESLDKQESRAPQAPKTPRKHPVTCPLAAGFHWPKISRRIELPLTCIAGLGA